MKTALLCLAFVYVAATAGCGLFGKSKPEPPPPTRYSAKLSAGQDVNLDLEGRPSPVVVKVFELKKATAFNGADFGPVFDKPQDALGGDLVVSDELLLAPGETRVLEKAAEAGAAFVGLVAAFQRIDGAEWRVVLPLPPNATSTFEVRLTQNRMTAEVKATEPSPEGEKSEAETDKKEVK